MKIIIKNTKKIVLKALIGISFLTVLTIVIVFARGYRVNISDGKITSTGILSVSSVPKAAKIFINGKLQGATDTNLTLPHGKYTVEIVKEGYSSFKKEISLKGEIVMSVDAKLFLKNPALTPLTSIGIAKAIPVGNSDRLILISKSDNPVTDGIYLFEPSTQPVKIFPPLKLILASTKLPAEYDILSANFIFDKNYERTFVTFSKSSLDVKNNNKESADDFKLSYLLKLNMLNSDVYNLSSSYESISTQWALEKLKERVKIFETLPKNIQSLALENFVLISVSPNGKKYLYTPKKNIVLPLVKNPPLIGSNQEQETRTLVAGKIYVYDKTEDKNFELKIGKNFKLQDFELKNTGIEKDLKKETAYDEEKIISHIRNVVAWSFSSQFFFLNLDNKIQSVYYDSTAPETIYEGPYDNSFFGVLPNDNLSLVINLNPQKNSYGELYSVDIL